MKLLALATSGLGVVDPATPVIHADNGALLRGARRLRDDARLLGHAIPLRRPRRAADDVSSRIGLPPVNSAEIEALVAQALAAAAEGDAVLRVYWTPGREHDSSPQALVLVSALPATSTQRVSVVSTSSHFRWDSTPTSGSHRRGCSQASNRPVTR